MPFPDAGFATEFCAYPPLRVFIQPSSKAKATDYSPVPENTAA